MSERRTKKAISEDITRRVHVGGRVHVNGRVSYNDAFIQYAHQRIAEVARLDEVPELEWNAGTADHDECVRHRQRDAERRRRYEIAFDEIACALNIRYAVLRRSGKCNNSRVRDVEHSLTDAQYAAFRTWEDASRRIGPVRDVVAILRELPDEAGRDAINATWQDLDDLARTELRAAVEDYLLAVDLAGELGRLMVRSSAAATATYERRVALEPLVALAPVAETERPVAQRPLLRLVQEAS